ncbi:hypothetical protein Holit_02887 [Hollandina sp. SP2]
MAPVQNSVSFAQALEKSGQMPAFSLKSKVTVSKLEVLKQPPFEFEPGEHVCGLISLISRAAAGL